MYPQYAHRELRRQELLADAEHERLVEGLTPPTPPPRRGIALNLEEIALRLRTLWHARRYRRANLRLYNVERERHEKWT